MTTIKLKNGSGAPATSDLVQGEPALDLTNKRLYTENASGTIIEVGTNPTSLTTGTFTSTGIDDNATSTAITIDASQNVGIGTTSPASKLEISGTGTGAWVTLDRQDSGTNLVDFTQSGTRLGYIGYSVNDLYLNNATASNTIFNTSNTERMRIDSSGNVGIGTASPSYKLHVSQSSSGALVNSFADDLFVESSAHAGITIGSGATSTGNLAFTDSGNNFVGYVQYNHGDNSMRLGSNASEAMRIDINGNVGIGTSSINSSYRLNVEGAIIPILAKSSSTGTSSTYACVAAARPLNVVGNGSGYGMNMNNSSGSMAEYGYIGGLIENNTASSHSGALIFAPTSSGTRTERMRIDSSGNVGIGNTIFTSARVTAPHLVVGDATNSPGLTLLGGAGNQGSINFADAASGTGGYDGGFVYGFGSGTPYMTFHVNGGSERMRIDSSGNLLVGKTSTTLSASGMMVIAGNSMTLTIASGTTYHLYDGSNYKFYVNANGGIYNYQANDVNLSDQRVKKDIVDSSNYLEKLCNIPVRNFRYNEDAENGKHHLGVIAQEVEVVAPEFVNKASWEHKDGPMDTVYNTDLMFAMMKSIQELSTQVTELKAEVAALKGE